MKAKIILLITIVFSFIISCEDNTVVFNPHSDTLYKKSKFSTLAGQFDYIWHGLDNSYVFWYKDTTDWDNIRKVYLPKFEELDKKGKRGEEIYDSDIRMLMKKAFSSLLDHHLTVYMSNPYGGTRYVIEETNAISSVDYTDDYYRSNLFANYNIGNKKAMTFKDNGLTLNAYSCVLNNYIPLLHAAHYYITDSIFCQNNPTYLDIVNNFFDNIKTLSSLNKLKGIIIDNRFNLGGAMSDEFLFIQTFSSTNVEVARYRTKYGLGRLDYSPWMPMVVKHDENKYIDIQDVPIVILQDRYSASVGELVGYALSLLPNTYILGDYGHGALSPLVDHSFDFFHSGSFNADSIDYYLENYGNVAGVKTATACFEIINKRTGKYEQLEGIGIEPDEIIQLNKKRFMNGQGDNQIDAAIEYINKKTRNYIFTQP